MLSERVGFGPVGSRVGARISGLSRRAIALAAAIPMLISLLTKGNSGDTRMARSAEWSETGRRAEEASGFRYGCEKAVE